MTVGQIDWEPFEKQHIVRGFYEDQIVATIEYESTHKALRKEVFQVFVDGERCGDPIHNVSAARQLGSNIYEKRMAAK